MDRPRLTITQAHDLIRKKEITARELTEAVLARISAVEPLIGAFITVTAETARAQAAAADAAVRRGAVTPLTGIPLGFEDLISTRGVRTTCGSRMLADFTPPYDAFVVRRLAQQHAVMVGKLNLDEFGMGATTEYSAFKVTVNPWRRDCAPGGSSGGAAAAVAADLCLGALGCDTGGALRQPAAHCGVVGLKPTYGRVSRFGLGACASSMDQAGPLTRSVADCALLLQAVAGHDPADATSAPCAVPDYRAALQAGVRGLRVGVAPSFFDNPALDPEVAAAVRRAIAALEACGARTVTLDLPHSAYGAAACHIIAACEAGSNLARFDGVRYGLRRGEAEGLSAMYRASRAAGFGPEVRRRVILGTYALAADNYAAYYEKAVQVRTLISEDFKQAFAGCDLIAAPVAPTPAPRLGAQDDDPLAHYRCDLYTAPVSLAGLPAIALPCGLSADGRPIGVQLAAPPFEEPRLLRAAFNLEQAGLFNHQPPALGQERSAS